MGDRPDDLVPLLGGQPGDSGPVRWGTGTVIAWDAETGANVIQWRSTNLTNLPIIAASTWVLRVEPGDTVGLNIIGSGAAATVYIVGPITQPGPEVREIILSTIGAQFKVAENDTLVSTSLAAYQDLGGPSVPATIGESGRALVLFSSQIGWSDATVDGAQGGRCGLSVDGAAPLEPERIQAYTQFLGTTANVTIVQVAGFRVVDNLTPGLHTFKLLYQSITGGKTADFDNRTIAVLGM